MILYRKVQQLRLRRAAAPEPPFFCATSIAPYAARRAVPIALDHLALRASGTERLEVGVAASPASELERVAPLPSPFLVDATGPAESLFQRGDEAASWCEREGSGAVLLLSPDGAIPESLLRRSVLAVSTWPADVRRIEAMFERVSNRSERWGAFVPLLYPLTTDLGFLDEVARAAARHGATFLGSASIELEATARQALAQLLDLSDDDDRYAMLFHGRVEPLAVATERHVAALAVEHGLGDAVALPSTGSRSNWNAAVHLTLVASRMMAMELDLDLAGLISRSARAVATLDKPLERIAESANLSIVGALDETSAAMLSEWLDGGSSSFGDYVDELWRLRRDAALVDATTD